MTYRTISLSGARVVRFRVGNARFNRGLFLLAIAAFATSIFGFGLAQRWVIAASLAIYLAAIAGGKLFEWCPLAASIEIDQRLVVLNALGRKRSIPLSSIAEASVYTEAAYRGVTLIGLRLALTTGDQMMVPVGRQDWFAKRAAAIVEEINRAVARDLQLAADPLEGR